MSPGQALIEFKLLPPTVPVTKTSPKDSPTKNPFLYLRQDRSKMKIHYTIDLLKKSEKALNENKQKEDW